MVICAMMCPRFCVQMWMSAWWLMRARASCASTPKDPIPAGAAEPACNCPRMVTAVRVRVPLCLPTCLNSLSCHHGKHWAKVTVNHSKKGMH